MTSVIQRSLAGGELAPALYARADVARYATGLKTCRNFQVMRHGGARNRAGLGFVAEAKDSTVAGRLLKFVFNAEQTYVLELGYHYLRVHRAGVQLTEADQTITGATAANPVAITIAAHGYASGDEVYISGVGGMTELNNRNFKVVVTGANTFTLQYMDGTAVDGTAFTAYTSGGTAARVYEIATPYATADLRTLQYVQSGDVVTIVHPSYAPRDLARTGHTSWTLGFTSFAPTIAAPTALTAVAGTAGAVDVRYRVTAVAAETYEESLRGMGPTAAITGATQANPVVITSAAHGLANGEEVYLAGVGGMTELNLLTYTVANVTANTFELAGIDGTAFTAYTAGGTWQRTYARCLATDPATSAAPNVVTWTAAAGALEYNVYRERNGVYGYIGVARGGTFRDTGYTPDTTDTPPDARNPFATVDNYPSTVTYFQQRRLFANTNTDTERVEASRTANFTNFTRSSPLQDDDAISFRVAGRQVNAVRHLLDLGELFVFTAGAEYMIEGGGTNGALTPAGILPRNQGYNGSATLAPLVVNNSALFLQARGSVVRDLRYELKSDGYNGRDLTVYATHLFEGYELVAWDYQQIPDSIVWAVRDDGTLLGLTYLEEHEIWGWHRHDTDGLFEDVVCVPEGDEDAAYFFVNRTVDGRTVRYLERMHSRRVTDPAIDAVFMDSALSYDGRNTTAATMTLSRYGSVYAALDGSAGAVVRTPSSAALQLTGDLDLRVRASLLDWTPGTVQTLLAKSGGAADRAYEFSIDATGKPVLVISQDGTTVTTDTATAATGVANGAIKWLRVTLDADIGLGQHRVEFFTSDDGAAWAPLGLAVVGVGALTPYASTGNLELGGRYGGSDQRLVGNVYYAEARNGIAGTVVAAFNPNTDAADGVDPFVSSVTGETWTCDGTAALVVPGWTVNDTLTLTASAAFFTSADVGNAIDLTVGSDSVRLNILGYTSATVVTGSPSKTVPAALQAVATATWTKAVDQLTGLWHLEGASVSILADGSVIANGLDAPAYTVTDGTLTLDRPYGVIHVGLGYLADLQTLDIDSPAGETLSDKRLLVDFVTVHVESSRGLWAGSDADNLYEWPPTPGTTAGRTGKPEINISSTWSTGGNVFIRQRDPLPLTVLAIIPNGQVGG